MESKGERSLTALEGSHLLCQEERVSRKQQTTTSIQGVENKRHTQRPNATIHRGHNPTVSAQSMLNAHAHLDPGCHMGGKAHVPVTGHIHQSTDNTSVHYCLEGNQASLTSSSSFSRVLSDICRFFSTPPATTQNAVFRELSGPL